MKRIIILCCLIGLALSVMASGCQKIGKATGKTVKEVKEMPREFKEGYKDGRSAD